MAPILNSHRGGDRVRGYTDRFFVSVCRWVVANVGDNGSRDVFEEPRSGHSASASGSITTEIARRTGYTSALAATLIFVVAILLAAMMLHAMADARERVTNASRPSVSEDVRYAAIDASGVVDSPCSYRGW